MSAIAYARIAEASGDLLHTPTACLRPVTCVAGCRLYELLDRQAATSASAAVAVMEFSAWSTSDIHTCRPTSHYGSPHSNSTEL